ncbi:hypothetical protein CLA01_34240 [Chryseobacterium lathyri]|jgi:hypothetical protein|uniref:Transposase n=1 Tax=Chryseobacterium lathyri TaxID=395933 RepID=A0A511YDT2_9FLAO|nr:helix-turn-helix domain-containing protein [Chryseobacterium lathyri]GEN73352.1 hypothetical protein CLA01_34240 [Chryseobacterium lathyri]
MDRKIRQQKITLPDYKKIYSDLIELKHPEKKELCRRILSKDFLSKFDVIKINNLILGNNNKNTRLNQRYRSYDKETIIEILKFQKKKNLNNTQLANHYKLSRNTITKWKRILSDLVNK